MANRQRSTWAQGKSRKAAAPPAVPGYDKNTDPDADAFANGDTSSWAEDVNKPPYPQGEPPAVPGAKTAGQFRAYVEKKAAKAYRVARLVLGNAPELEVEAHALDLMDYSDSALDRMASASKVAADDDFDASDFEEDEDEGCDDKEASAFLAANAPAHECKCAANKVAQVNPHAESLREIKASLDRLEKLAEQLLAADVEDKKEEVPVPPAFEEPKVAAPPVLAPPVAPPVAPAVVAAPPVFAPPVAPPADEVVADHAFFGEETPEEEALEAEHPDTDSDIMFDAEEDHDPMSTEGPEDELLAGLYAAEEDPTEDPMGEVQMKPMAPKQANKERPMPKKPSVGPKTLGSLTRTAGSKSNDLEALWDSPDASLFERLGQKR